MFQAHCLAALIGVIVRAKAIRRPKPMLAMRVVVVSVLILVCAHSFAHAAAPKELYNKTVTVTWTESGTYTRVSDGKSANPTGRFKAIVYISSAGRLFVRASSTNGNFSSSAERGREHNNVQFEGDKLVMTAVSIGIARRLVTTFDASFGSYTTSVTIGKLSPNAKIVGFDREIYKVISMQAGGASCAIANGNALAN